MGVFALTASVNVGIEVYIIQCCRSLSMMADVFRCKMIEHSDFVGVVREWNLIHALCREVSRTNQPGVVVCIADWFDTVQLASRNVGIEVYIIQCCRCLSMMADVFRCKMIEHSDSVGVAREWNLIHALCREVSRTNQPAVVVCQQELQPHWCALQDWA